MRALELWSTAYNLATMTEADEVQQLRSQARAERKLLQKAADALAEIDRNQGLSDRHADVLAALRIRLEGKERASLEDLLTATGEISGARDLGQAIQGGDPTSPQWPVVEEKKKEWPGL
jgi:hypothetical protein